MDKSKKFDGLDLLPELKRKFLLMRLSLGLPAPHEARLRAQTMEVAATSGGSYGAG